MNDLYYLKMIEEQLIKNLTFTAYVNVGFLIKDTKDKKLRFHLLAISQELKQQIDNKNKKNLDVIIDDINNLIRRMN